MKKSIMLIFVFFFFFSYGLPAQTLTLTDACAQAQMDAQADVNQTIWFFAGCFPVLGGACLLGIIGGSLGGITGIGAAYLIEPSPSPTHLLGQPSDYVVMYTQCYKEKGKSIQLSAATKGCLAGASVWGIFILYYIFVLSSAYYYY